MLESSRFRAAQQLALVAFLCAVVAAFATAYSDPRVWSLLAPAALSVAWRPRRIPDRLRRALPYVGWVLAGLTVVYGTAWTLYPVIPERIVALYPRIAGYVLIGLAALFTLGSRVWPPARTAIGAGLCALMVAAFETAPGRRPAATIAFAAAALLAFLFLEDVAQSPKGPLQWRRVVLAVVFCASPVAIAVGLILLLPWAQPHVEQATASLINARSGIHFAGLSSSSRLGDIEQIALSRRIVMRVWSPRAQKLRARVFTGFDGRSWHAPASARVRSWSATGMSSVPIILLPNTST